ncbi:MAG TPA: sodium/solute symporter [Candidatus Hydrogenedentes bacterium]|nr:sodium/solute symporter [Candidatus Hydrogenedentota bacterium]HPK23894.1 sodium/solute symporter [Candidatus Hydrogenedentota bacterium]
MEGGFAFVDWTILFIYMGVMLVIGALVSRQQSDSQFFFLGGRSMPSWAVALSVVATALSAATFIGVPQMAFEGDFTYLATNLGAMIAAFIIAFYFVPPIYAAGTVTIYGYLGQRYGESARTAAGAMFLLGRLLSSGARLFMAGIGFSLMLYGETARHHLIFAILLLGIVGTLYTVSGGIRAVIWTDVIQIIVMVVAALAAVAYLVSLIPLTPGQMVAELTSSQGVNKLKVLDFSLNFSNPFTFWSALFAMTIVSLSTHGVDQDMLQRVMTAKSPFHGGLALIGSMAIAVPIILVFLIIGALLHLFYTRPDLMGNAFPPDVVEDTRRLFPQFVLQHLPVGLRGLTMAGLIAAAMSTFDSAINAMASSLIADLYAPLRAFLKKMKSGQKEEEHLPDLAGSRFAVGLMGFLLTLFAIGAIYLQEQGGESLINFALGVMAFAQAPLLGVFCTALFTRRGNAASALTAFATGIGLVLLLQPYMLPKWAGFTLGWTWIWAVVSPVCFLICLCGSPGTEEIS